ncbi:S-layer homology domain-containing protein [Cohnella mopanensis]|uniref:S-layer homology domain-containing protein n=1 Tax=Cohnella mopanensis TaxID=2911966 RepID=UPI001EF90522|nr:S-layer homology domain-containing protein [Cohnella mopanensis]
MKKKVSKSITGLLAASLVCSGVSLIPASASAASPFSDVKPGWAEKHIAKLALQGLLKGGSDGKFNPTKSLSRQEAVIIALRFMGVEQEVNKTEALVFPSVLVIKEDYKPYIKLALKKKILLIGEETELAEKEKGKEWGNSPATREWMTRLLVRAIGKDAEAELAKAQNTSFGDDAKIDAGLKGYVNVAVSTGLVSGINGKFEPTQQVSREMASTLFSRAEDKISVAYSGQVVGTLTAVSSDKITLRHPDGVVKEYKLSPTASIYGYKSETSSAITTLKLYTNVILISNSDGSVGYVEQTSESANVKDYEGTLTLVTESESKLTFLINNDYKPFNYDAKNPPTIKDVNGQVLTISQLPLNVPVKFTVESPANVDGKILSLTVNQSVTNKTGAGTVAAWNAAGLSLQVKDAAGKTDTYPVASTATLKHSDANLTLDQLVVGDAITYEVKNGTVTSMVVTKKVQPPITGVVSLIDKVGKTIQYTVNNKLAAEYLADNVTVQIEGLPNVTLDDLFKGDTISMTMNDSGKVSVISVTGRSVSFLNGATVTSNGITEDLLVVTSTDNVRKPLLINESTRFDLNGVKITQKEAAQYITKGKKINVGYTGSNAAYVSIVSQYVGTVVENNTTARTLKISLDNANTVTLPYSNFYPTVEIYGQNNPSFLDVHAGDKITAVMDYLTQEQIVSVLVQKSVQFDLVSADVATNKLRAKRADGVIEEWNMNLSTLITLQDENGTSISLSALNQSNANILNVTFKGKSPQKIKATATTYGRVSSVNSSASSLDIVINSGATITKSFTTAPIIKKDNATLNSLASVQPEDRVEIRLDENDRPVIQIIPALRKTIQLTDSNQKFVYIFIDTFGETNKYSVDPKAYIHQGSKTLTLSDLKRDDAVSLYILRGNVIEISK